MALFNYNQVFLVLYFWLLWILENNEERVISLIVLVIFFALGFYSQYIKSEQDMHLFINLLRLSKRFNLRRGIHAVIWKLSFFFILRS